MLIHAKEVLADQLLGNSNDQGWYLSFEQAIEGVTEEEAFYKLHSDSHSIAQIIVHLIYWNETWQKRYKSRDVAAVAPLKDNAESFLMKEELTLSCLKEKLLEVLLQWQELLDEEQLELEVKGFPVSISAKWWGVLANCTTHNAYHIGQIVYIKKYLKARYE